MADDPPGTQDAKKEAQPEFKKPVLVGKLGKLPKKAKNNPENVPEESNEEKPNEIQININICKDSASKSSLPPAVLLKELSTPIPYKEPKWSGICPDGSGYALEVLKSGCILERIDLTTKPYYVFGRLANCDVVLAHPTISRHHAVVQYKAQSTEGGSGQWQPPGWYVYELGSTHGTFLNKCQLKPAHYTRLRVGHHIKFGNSTRTYVMLGPDFDCEGESELSVSEIKQRTEVMRVERDRMIQEAKEQREKNRAEEEKKREDQGIDWGMGEDAEEEPDLSDNPFAVTTNEELYLDDPKKTLRGYFEREGHELTYDCEERGHGQYICRVSLPLEDSRGRGVVAEALHAGKKKEAVVACALEACRLLDRAGLLRQPKHESRARKSRDWSADDYYSSDDDTFLDRTGAVERKRRRRMRHHAASAGAAPADHDKPLTYEQLLKRIEDLESKIKAEEETLQRLRGSLHTNKQSAAAAAEHEEQDDLDAYMSALSAAAAGHSMAVKADISNSKMCLARLRAELSAARRGAELARPRLPPLAALQPHAPAHAPAPAPAPARAHNMPLRLNNSVIYGKRLKLKDDERRPKPKPTEKKENDDFVEEVDSDEDTPDTSQKEKNVPTVRDTRPEPTDNHSQKKEIKVDQISGESETETQIDRQKTDVQVKKVYGPMRPPENYVIPEDYFNQESDRDLPEIMEKDHC